MSKYLYILDNGHGIDTKGKKSRVWDDRSQLKEFEFNRDIVKYISFELKSLKIDYKILVPELVDIPLYERIDRANDLNKSRKCVLISIHGNAFHNANVKGIETLYHYTSPKSFRLAWTFQYHLINDLHLKNRGLKPRTNISILKKTNMPAVLTENGFYTNRKECEWMLHANSKYMIAQSHVKSIQDIEKNIQL